MKISVRSQECICVVVQKLDKFVKICQNLTNSDKICAKCQILTKSSPKIFGEQQFPTNFVQKCPTKKFDENCV